jgi:hypothetical protein
MPRDNTQCLNCGEDLLGPYCFGCGQHVHVHRSLAALFHDLAHGIFHFEGKVWRTLPLLALRPGELTRRYIDGERVRFVSPVALFLFCLFLAFAVTSVTGSIFSTPAAVRKEVAGRIESDRRQVRQLQRLEAVGTEVQRRDAGLRIDALEKEIDEFEAISRDEIPAELPSQSIDVGGKIPGWAAKVVAQARRNPQLVFFKLKTEAYKFGWALIPLSVPFVCLLFPFSSAFKAYDHTVFVTYSLAFMMLLLVTAALASLVSPALASLALFVPPLHLYRHARGTYSLTGWGALWRTAALTAFAFVAVGVFAVLLIGLGSLG